MIAAKKDKFYCNGKEISNAKQFLDVAGFMNPYFIVRQGKVQELAVGTDAFRLKLLEDVTGSTSYEQKLEDYRKSVDDGDAKKTEMEKCLTDLKDRQDSLANEATELKQYLKWDSKRRSIEQILNQREMASAQTALKSCEAEREKVSEQVEPIQKEWQELKKDEQTVTQNLANVASKYERVQAKREIVDSEVLSLVSEKERLKNLREEFLSQSKNLSKKQVNAQLKKLQSVLSEMELELAEAKNELELAKSNELNVEQRVISKDSKLRILESRLGGEFLDSKEIVVLISNIKKDIEKNSKKLDSMKKTLATLENSKKTVTRNLEGIQEEHNNIRIELAKLQKASTHPDAELFKAEKARREMWKTLNEVEQKMSNEKGVRLALMEHLQRKVGREAINGWEGVHLAIEELRKNGEDEIVEGYYGLVIENIECEDSFDLAVETAGGIKLFNHVVKNRKVGMRILKEFNRLKLRGAPTFIPIDDIQVPVITYPPDHRDHRPLMNDINCSPGLEKLVSFIFGPILLCRELSDATSLAKIHKITCVTTAGDKVFRTGPISGGYMELGLGKLELQRAKAKSDQSLESLSHRKFNAESQLEKLEKHIAEAGSASVNRESKKCVLMAKKDDSACKLKRFEVELKSIEVSFTNTQKETERLSREIYELTCRKTNYEAELERQSQSTPSQSDRKMVSNLRNKLKKLTKEKKEIFSKRMNIEKVITSLTLKIQQQHTLVEEERFKELELHSSQEHGQRLSDINEMIDSITDQINKKISESNNIAESIPQLAAKRSKLKAQLDNLDDKEKKIMKSRNQVERRLDKLCTEALGLNQKLQEITEAGTKFATVPGDSNKFQNESSKVLYEKLKKINKYIGGVSGVNQKAAEQYQELVEQYAAFKENLEQLCTARDEMDQLVADLEEKRADAILKNFRVLQQQFKEIFSQIVPKGIAELILYGKNFHVDSETLDSDKIRKLLGRGVAEGLKINVNFINNRLPEMCNIIQLSGGQKSVVALCLILAIQKIDPVPFYLFDEVDQALDPQYRAEVTKVIHGLSSEFNLQFICTTFRREFLSDADKFYGVSMTNKCSTVRPVDIHEAVTFVEHSSQPE
ncbi:structural maintenance of chromosomes protein 3 [Folsomia candida]|nr:structural maintenance of chromosomes protein 3 [Folsomia candida]